ncbi:Heat shock protein 12A [Grifola frondosa]|uniref:Heat shock protein 12A n=1 Tax=Grifola frondosa TaxID=5627 RepID=A0A1C7M862_GRIFR|nr:Heat shock protein 12A [Grifola frondosa]
MNKKLSDIFKVAFLFDWIYLVLTHSQCGEAVIVVDAGGGTVDISTYKITNSSPLVRAQECAVTKCLLQGSTFVNSRAETYLREKLRHSPYGSNEDILEMLKDFEKSAKPSFKGGSRNTMIKFGSPKAPDDIERGVSRGRLSLSSKEMIALFDPSIRAIEEAITEQRQSATGSIKTILLSGGFSASPFLRARLQTYAESAGVSLYYPDTEGQSPAKAVAEGALAFYIDHCVFARMAKRTYGIQGSTMFWPFNPEHLQRVDQVFLDCEGDLCLPRHFAPVLKKGTLVTADEEFVCSFLRNTPEPIDNIQTSIVCYKGDKSDPHWTDVEPEMFLTYAPFKPMYPSWLEDGQEKR